MTKNSITLSEKHGVNPAMIICAFCQEDMGIALMGRLSNDAEAPRKIITDYEPCDKCKERMSKGITLIGVTHKPYSSQHQPIGKDDKGHDIYPTGSYCVVTEEFIKRTIEFPLSEQILMARKTLVDQTMLEDLMNSVKQTSE